MSTNGMPGPGGSLGQCAMCGRPFLAEVLGVGKVVTFTLDQVKGDLYAHQKCVKAFGHFTSIEHWPEASPVRQAIERHNAGVGDAR